MTPHPQTLPEPFIHQLIQTAYELVQSEQHLKATLVDAATRGDTSAVAGALQDWQSQPASTVLARWFGVGSAQLPSVAHGQ